MQDIVGDRLKKQIQARRKDRMQYLLLYSFLGVNALYIGYQLLKRFI